MDPIQIDFKEGPLNIDDLGTASEDTHGAEAWFMGKVRNLNHGRTVKSLSYDIHSQLAHKVLKEICQEAQSRWEESAKAWVMHSYGNLKVGDISVMIKVTCPHRDESFHICRYIIEELKKRAPIWKKEFYSDGESEWLKGHALCQHATSV
ncbi:MAG: molybdenum cofactor biosynthesis protein MoaE [Oligoflexales bacterium]|nr:molybdenum cofactor biosynthesis protein MoaE [Oligoflexales bacterium]